MYASAEDALLWEENFVKLLDLIIDSESTFNSYVQMVCETRLVRTFSEHLVPSLVGTLA